MGYMLGYRQACKNARLAERDFEKISGMPAGLMDELRPYCEVHTQVRYHTHLTRKEPMLFFTLQGGMTEFQMMKEDVKSFQDEGFMAEVAGFTGRGNKRLRRRF